MISHGWSWREHLDQGNCWLVQDQIYSKNYSWTVWIILSQWRPRKGKRVYACARKNFLHEVCTGLWKPSGRTELVVVSVPRHVWKQKKPSVSRCNVWHLLEQTARKISSRISAMALGHTLVNVTGAAGKRQTFELQFVKTCYILHKYTSSICESWPLYSLVMLAKTGV